MKVDLVYISLFLILSVALHSSYLLDTLYFCAILNNSTLTYTVLLLLYSVVLPNSSFAYPKSHYCSN